MICLLFPFLAVWKGTAPSGQLIIRAAREGQPFICLSALFAPVLARGPSSERALRRRPSYHLPFVSFAHLYSARPFVARGPSVAAYHCLSALFAPVMARGPSSERALRRRPSYHLPFCFIFQPLWRAVRAGQLIIAFLLNLPPFWRAERPRSESSVGGTVIVCLIFELPTFMKRGPSGPAYHCLSGQFSPIMAPGSSEPASRLHFCSICSQYSARPERAS